MDDIDMDDMNIINAMTNSGLGQDCVLSLEKQQLLAGRYLDNITQIQNKLEAEEEKLMWLVQRYPGCVLSLECE